MKAFLCGAGQVPETDSSVASRAVQNDPALVERFDESVWGSFAQ